MNHFSADPIISHPQRIVGCEREMQALTDWLKNPGDGAQVFAVSGIGGIGKTTLLTNMAVEARLSAVRVLWVDGQICLHTPKDLLAYLEMSLETEYGRTRTADETLFGHVAAELCRERTVVLLDNCEALERIESWLLAQLLPRLRNAPLLLVMASRTGLPLHWYTDQMWSPRIRSFPLELFTREQVYAYLQDSGLPEQVQQDIARKSEGHPLLLALTTDLMRREGADQAERAGQLPGILSAELLREAADPFMYDALELLSLFPAADQTMLNRLLKRPLNAAEYTALGRLSCVRVVPGGLALHQVVSRMLREEYKQRHPGEYSNMRRLALKLLIGQYPAADRLRQMQYAAHALELYREQLPAAHRYVDFSGIHGQEQRQSFQPEDLPYLHRFLAVSLSRSDWQSELVKAGTHHRLLDDIAAYSPMSILVTRDAEGIPLAFSAGLWLHEGTMPLLERYAPFYLDVLGQEAGHLRTLSPEAADTMCLLLAAVNVEQSYYRPEELGAALFQSWMIETTNGLRAIIATEDQQLHMLLPLSGFQAIEPQQLERHLPGMIVWELDLRQASFEVWVERVIQQSFPQEKPEAAFPPLPWEEVRSLLQHLYDDGHLLAQPALAAAGMNGAEIRELLQGLLSAEQPPSPLTELEQQILRESYLRKNYGKAQLADAFHMSRTTFYRHTRQALEHLGYVLAGELKARGKGVPQPEDLSGLQ